MRYDTLAADEAAFKNRTDYTFTPFTVPVAGENLSLKGVFCKPKSRSGYFNTPEPPHPKQRIVLHFTAGNLSGGINTLTTQNFRVSVPFVIARDGTIYQLFPSKDWSGHIGAGIGNAGTGNAQDKVTIAIEIINYGYLVERGANLETIYSRPKENPGRIDLYCPLTQTEAYQKLNQPFRDQRYYASYTQKQYESLIVLLRFLTKKYNIPRQFLDESVRYQGTQDVLSFKGIVSHVNYRTSGKWDLGPAFDWQQVIAGVQAAAYQPASATREAFGAEEEGLITDEAALETQWAEPRGVEVAPPEDFESHFNNEESTTMKPNLYALVVGIDAYEDQVVLNQKVAFPQLRGCVADATKIRRYLENDASFEQKHIQFLTNQQATKVEIVKAFRDLGKAGKDDVIVFYYSGHGTQEAADTTVWTSEQDGKLECLVSYYDEDHDNDYLISDKELRYLLGTVSQSGAHITVISDCCHSGDNTRNAGLIKSTYEKVIERRIPYVFPQRTWEKFIFNAELSPDDFAGRHIDVVLPPARHVSLSACESDESAVEVSGEGVFTKYLLKSLEASGGQLSYSALHGRVRQMLNNAFEQTPVMYIPPAYHRELALNNVFNKPGGADSITYADVIRDGAGNWVLQRGAVHGIGRETRGISVRDDDKVYEAKVRSVGADTTILAFDDATEAELDTTRIYKGYVEGLMSQQLKIHLNNVDNVLTDSLLLTEKLMSEIPAQARLEAKEADADYTLSFRNGRAVLTKPFDTFRPVVEQIELDSEAFASELVKDLKHISNWHFLKNLRSDAAGTALRIEVSDGDGQPITSDDGVVRLHYRQIDGEWKGSIRIKITNISNRKLYCCCVFLDAGFGASLGLLDPIVTPLDPGASKELTYNGQTTIPISLDNYVQLYNWPENAEYLQFIVSAEDLSNIEELTLESLPSPFTVGKKGSARGIGASARETDKNLAASWWTQLLTLEYVNPEYNIIAESELAGMLEDENLAEYALGNYFEVKTRPDLQPEYQLKPDVRLRKSDAHLDEKGFIRDGLLDVANKTARLIRNSKYRIMRLRFPRAPKIVSEGDSWFQHPLVVDTIDHLSKVYPIFCVAAAGDTLANYDREGEWLEAVEDKSPRFFLISGGGNDVLGEQFRSHIKPGPHATGLPPQDYLEASLLAELDNLQVIYRKMFNELFALRPDIHALCHGYDYITPLDKTDKGWLGRYMIEKGMTSQTDRKGVISYILNEFNDRLRAVASEFPNVHYINARGLVADDQWYDEIHPNKHGFQAVAGSFLNVIDGLVDN